MDRLKELWSELAEELSLIHISANFLNMDRSRKIGGYFVAEQTEVPEEDEAVCIPVFMKDMGSVSYTHLDVYKRQGYVGSHSSAPGLPPAVHDIRHG